MAVLSALYKGNTYMIFEGRIHNWIFLLDGGVRFMLTLRTFWQTVYSLSFRVMLVKIVRTMMVTSILGRSVSLPNPSAEGQKSERGMETSRKTWHQFPQLTTSNMAAGMGFYRPLSFRWVILR